MEDTFEYQTEIETNEIIQRYERGDAVGAIAFYRERMRAARQPSYIKPLLIVDLWKAIEEQCDLRKMDDETVANLWEAINHSIGETLDHHWHKHR